MTKKVATKKKPGRKRKDSFDLLQIERLGALGVTDEELAAVLGLAVSTVYERKKDLPGFSEALEKGRQLRKVSLRRAQTQLALSGDRTMLIWLGKQDLGQKDREVREVIELPGPLVLEEWAE